MSGEHFRGPELNDNSKLYEEMQKQLGNAETRCNTLKHQLDYMKKVCQNKSVEVLKMKNGASKISNHKSSNESVPPDGGDELDLLSKDDTVSKMFEKTTWPIRQNSRAIGTDKTGAAVKTINNILTGITESVNRLSVLTTHIDEKGSRPNSKRYRVPKDPLSGGDVCERKDSTTQTHQKGDCSEDKSQPTITIESSTMISVTHPRKRPRPRHNKTSKSKVESSSATINLNNKKSIKSTAKRSEKRLKLNTVRTAMLESNSITSSNKRRHRKRRSNTYLSARNRSFLERNFYTENLVELYHNAALNQASESDDDHLPHIEVKSKKVPAPKTMCKMTCSNSNSAQQQQQEGVPPLQIQEMGDNYNGAKNELSPIQEVDYLEPPAAPRTEYSTCTRNYELPTIASKMKQVAKSYLRSFDFRAIPFCAARSTSPSHNIGINIQQVMSIIKTRQPISGISPTLAHNIGLAAEKLHSRPLSALVSSLGSRVTYSRPLCPLMRQQLNYQQLQEMAKEIPEEEMNNCVMTEGHMNGASGDTEHKYQESIWTIDPSMQRTCTCYSQQGLGFQQVINRYQSKMSARASNSQIHYKINSSKFRVPKYLQRHTCPPKLMKYATIPESLSDEAPLKGKEKSLKDVLKHLHDDFELLNQRYEEVSRKLNEGGEPTDENVRDLENMEKDLSHKEEEINMVMALYKEVLSLKDQVKNLKERNSHASISATMTPMTPSRMGRYGQLKDSNAAFYLTKLLRQIQNYQESLKKEGRF